MLLSKSVALLYLFYLSVLTEAEESKRRVLETNVQFSIMQQCPRPQATYDDCLSAINIDAINIV